MNLRRDRPEAERRREFLAAHDAPCPACGYNLRGVDTLYCPECARVLDLPSLMEMRPPEPWYGPVSRRTWRAWILANMLLFIVTAPLVARQARWGPVLECYGVLFGAVVVSGVVWRFSSRGPGLDRLLTRCWWVVSGLHAAFVVTMLA